MAKIKSLLGIGVLFSASLLINNPSEAALVLKVVNNSKDFASVCMQGYSQGGKGQSKTYLIKQGQGASFSTTIPSKIPIFNVTSTSTSPLPIATYTTNPVLNIVGGRLYFWLSNTGCAANEAILTMKIGSLSVNPDKFDQTLLPFQIIELTDVSGSATIDLTYVDSFNLPVQLAVNQSISGAYPVGISNVQKTSDKTLKAIMNAYNTFMVSAYNGSPYLALATANANFPDGMGPILNPGSFVGQVLPGNSSPTIFKPNAASPLVDEFNASLNELFKKTIHINKTGQSNENFIGEPIDNIQINGAPRGLKGYGFCQQNDGPVSTSCNQTYQYYMLNPTGLVVSYYPIDHSLLMGYVPGSGKGSGATSKTINFTKPLPAGTLTEGMWIQAPTGNWAAPNGIYPNPQIVNCLSGSSVIPCKSSKINGVTVNIGPNPIIVQGVVGLNPFQLGTAYQFMFSMIPWNPNGNFGNSFMTAGEQVFNGSGVFGGGASATWDSQALQTSPDIGNLISTALNRGVTGTVCTTGCSANTDSIYWNTQVKWYPSNTTLNQFASFWHNATINNNIGELPYNAVSSSGYPGAKMATGYGFAYDENPMDGQAARKCPQK